MILGYRMFVRSTRLLEHTVMLGSLQCFEELTHRVTRPRAPRAMSSRCWRIESQAPCETPEPRTKTLRPPTTAAPSPPSTQRRTGGPDCHVKPSAREGRF